MEFGRPVRAPHVQQVLLDDAHTGQAGYDDEGQAEDEDDHDAGGQRDAEGDEDDGHEHRHRHDEDEVDVGVDDVADAVDAPHRQADGHADDHGSDKADDERNRARPDGVPEVGRGEEAAERGQGSVKVGRTKLFAFSA